MLGLGATGMAWAARREVIEAHGFYDACVAGGGCNAMFSAARLAPEQAIQRHRMSDRHAAHYRAWAGQFGGMVGGDIAALDGDVYHFWHGDLADHGRPARHLALADSAFDPDRDITIGQDGAWRWASDKPELREYFRHFFPARREDG